MARKKIEKETDQRPFSIIYHDFFKSNLLNTYEKMIFIALKIYSDNNNQCFPSLKKLSDITGISKRKIQNTLKEMELKHIISVENRLGVNGGKSSNLYILHDYKEIWNTESIEEITTNVIEEKHMIEILTSKGYYVTKEKEPETLSSDQRNNESSTHINNFDQSDITINSELSQDLERYSLDQIRQYFNYDVMAREHPGQKQNIDTVMNVLHNAMNTGKSTIRISGGDKPAMIVIGKLMKLSKESIMYAIDKFSEQSERIKNPTAYLLTILYNAPEQYYLDKKNQESNEMAQEDHSQEEKKTDSENKDSKNSFANFNQRTYDYEELERNLLNQEKSTDD